MFKIEKKYTGLFIVIDVHSLVHLLLVSFFFKFVLLIMFTLINIKLTKSITQIWNSFGTILY